MAGRILVIKLGALGDFLMATGAMKAIRAHHENAHIVLLTRKPFAALGEQCPFVDEVWIDTAPKLWNVPGWLSLRTRLRSAAFERVYDLQTSDRSGFYHWLLGPAPRPEWSGIAAGCSHPHTNPDRDHMHILDSRAEQLAAAGVTMARPDLDWLTADIDRFGLGADYALLVPGAAPGRPEKRWPVPGFAEIANRLRARGIRPVLVGTGAERAVLDDIKAAAPDVCDLGGKTDIADLAALARGARVVVGNDTGPVHLAAMAGVPTLALFSGASDPALCAPRGETVAVLRRPKLADLGTDEVWTQIAEML